MEESNFSQLRRITMKYKVIFKIEIYDRSDIFNFKTMRAIVKYKESQSNLCFNSVTDKTLLDNEELNPMKDSLSDKEFYENCNKILEDLNPQELAIEMIKKDLERRIRMNKLSDDKQKAYDLAKLKSNKFEVEIKK
jgi:uncharacterized protein YjaZ